MEDFEDQYLDVLQNIEFAIVNVYRHQPDLVDFDVETAINGLFADYRAQQIDREPRAHEFNPRAQQVYEAVQAVCEWRLGRESAAAEDVPLAIKLSPLSLDEIIACLKRIRKSVQTWTKRGGRQGYLLYVEQFIR